MLQMFVKIGIDKKLSHPKYIVLKYGSLVAPEICHMSVLVKSGNGRCQSPNAGES